MASAISLAIITQLGIGIHAATAATIAWAAIVLGLVNLIIRPIVRLLTLPLNLITLGLFGWVINAGMLWLVSLVVPGFQVSGFVPALEGAVLLAVISGVLHWLIYKI